MAVILSQFMEALFVAAAAIMYGRPLMWTTHSCVGLYERHYFLGEGYTNYLADRSIIERNFSRRFSTLSRWIDQARHRRLFEIGCAFGLFLNLVRSEFDVVEGIDISEDAARHARDELDLAVTTGDLLAHDFGTAGYDVVCMWDTIEHLKTPDLYVEAMANRMPAGGLLAITTGDISSLNARLKRERWRLIHPPTHLHYFSSDSMARMLDRLGFDVVYSKHCGFYRSFGAMCDGLIRLRFGLSPVGEWFQRYFNRAMASLSQPVRHYVHRRHQAASVRSAMIRIQIVAPAFNEAVILPEFIRCFLAFKATLDGAMILRLMVVDDGSTDKTLNVLREASSSNPDCISYVSFTGNAGHQAALVAGMLSAGKWPDAIITMDADLEHPFAVVPELIDVWLQTGAVVVHTIRRNSKALSWTKRWPSALFYRVTARLTGVSLRPGQADFKLWDAVALRSIAKYLPHVGSVRVFAAWMPGRQESIEYRPRRPLRAGEPVHISEEL